MKRQSVVMIVCVAAGAALGSTRTVSSVSDLNPTAETVGNDTLEYTGSGQETYAGTLTSAPGDKLASTVKVTDADAVLTLSKFARSSGGFVKTGLGSLCLRNAGFTFTGDDSQSGKFWDVTPKLTWTDGSAAAHYSPLVVHQGGLVLDFADRTQKLTAANSVVGHTSETSPDPSACLEIRSGVLEVGNSITIDRGAGRNGNCPQHSVLVGSSGRLSGDNIWLTSDSGGGGSYCGNALLDIDGGAATFAYTIQVGRSKGASKILVRNGGLLENTFQRDMDTTQNGSLHLPESTKATDATVEVTGVSTGRFYAVQTLRVGEHGVLKATDGATILNDCYRPSSLMNAVGGGVAWFDGATLAGWTSRAASDWFPYCEAYTVAAGGLTLFSDVLGELGGASRGTGTITLSGEGGLSLHPGQADVSVAAAGGLRMTASPTPTLVADADRTGTITVTGKQGVNVCGADALGAMTLVAGEQLNVFTAPGLEGDMIVPDPTAPGTTSAGARAGWTFAGAALPRGDGWFQMVRSWKAGTNGNVWRKEKIDVSKSFTVSFDGYSAKHSLASGCYYPYGYSLIFQNTAQGLAKLGTGGRACGFGVSDSKWPNSYAVGFDVADDSMRFARVEGNEGYFLNETGSQDAKPGCGAGTPSAPNRLTVSYDATNHRMTYSVYDFARSKGATITADVDLVAACGATSAYLGFGATSVGEAGNGEHFIGNVQFAYADETPAEKAVTGGTAQIAAGKTFRAWLDRGSRTTCWTMNELDYGTGSGIEIGGNAAATLGFAKFAGTGRLVKSGAGNLGLLSTVNRFPGDLEVAAGGLRFGEDHTYGDLLPMSSEGWWLSPSYAAFTGGGIGVGRANNGQALINGNANSRVRIPVNCPWTISYDLRIDFENVGGAFGFYAIYFQNDERGCTAVGTGTAASKWNCVSGIGNCAAVVWGGGDDRGSKEKNNQIAAYVNGVDSGWTSTAPVHMGIKNSDWGESGNVTHETNGTVRLTYDPAAKTLAVRMTQPAGSVTNVFETTLSGFDIPAAVGGDYAYVGFGANTAQEWYGMRQTVRNFRFEADVSSVPYVAGTITLKGPSTEFALDSATEGRTMNLANALVAPANSTIRLTNASAAAIATSGSVVCDGLLTIDGGVFAIDGTTLAGVKKLALVNGAKLKVAPGTVVTLGRLTVDGKRVSPGTYSDGFVTGGGAVEVSSRGLVVVFR